MSRREQVLGETLQAKNVVHYLSVGGWSLSKTRTRANIFNGDVDWIMTLLLHSVHGVPFVTHTCSYPLHPFFCS